MESPYDTVEEVLGRLNVKAPEVLGEATLSTLSRALVDRNNELAFYVNAAGQLAAGDGSVVVAGNAVVDFITVANATARLALTSAQVQNGDHVKDVDTGYVYELVDLGAISVAGSWVKIKNMLLADIADATPAGRALAGAANVAAQRNLLGIAQTIVVVGNSISVGGGLTDWTTVLETMETPMGRNVIVNNAVIAESLATTIANYAARVGAYKESITGRPLLVVLPAAGGSDVYGGTSAAATYQLIKDFVGMVRADGGKIVVGTVPPGALFTALPAAETRRAALNGLIAGDLDEFDFFWPLDKLLRKTDQPYFGGDDQHLSTLGHHMVAQDFLRAAEGAFNQGYVGDGMVAAKELVTGWVTDGFGYGGLRMEGHVPSAKAHIGVSPFGGTGMLCLELAPEGLTVYSSGTASIPMSLLGSGYMGINRLYFDGLAASGPFIASGSGTPEGALSAPVGSLFLRTNGTTSATLYAKTSGSGTTGWVGQVGGTVPAANGGTGQASYAVGDLLYANTTSALARLAGVATGNALISGGVGTAPSWGKVGLSTHVSGTLPVANGGTGLSVISKFSAHKNGTDQTGVAHNTWTKVTFGTEVFDVNGNYDSTNSRWTPTGGSYAMITAAIYFIILVPGTAAALALYRNGVEYLRFQEVFDTGGINQNAPMSGTVIVPVNGTDYYEIMVHQQSGVSGSVFGYATHTYWMGTVLP